jgi:hypothetical protein
VIDTPSADATVRNVVSEGVTVPFSICESIAGDIPAALASCAEFT